MKVGIITTKEAPSLKILREELELRGHEMFLLSDLRIDTLEYHRGLIDTLDVIYYWCGMSFFERFVIHKEISALSKAVFLDSAIFENTLIGNKIYQSYIVSATEIRVPETISVRGCKHEDIVKKIGLPYVIKKTEDSLRGSGVCLVKGVEDFERFTAVHNKKDEILSQELIPYDEDYRVYVVGGNAVCAYRRVPVQGEFRANIALGGHGEKINDEKLLISLYKTAEQITQMFNGADIVGVDIVRHKDTKELFFIEINLGPGIKEPKKVTGINIAGLIVDYFEEKSI